MALYLVFPFLLLSLFSGVSSLPSKRSGTSSAKCLAGSQYTWTMNEQNQSPCLLAAEVVAPCTPSGNWDIPALSKGYHYNPPNTSNNTVNSCYCSWAAYNLLSACAVCQGLEDSVTTWFSYKQDCGSMASTETYYPSDIPNINVVIPFYATGNPMHWTDSIFNVSQAAAQSQGHPDVNMAVLSVASTTSSSRLPTAATVTSASTAPTVTISKDVSHVSIGAIAGGTIVGLVVVLLSAALGIWFLRHKPKHEPEEDKTKLLKPENRVEPFPWSPPPTPAPSLPRVKSPSNSMAETERSSRSSTWLSAIATAGTMDNVADGPDISPVSLPHSNPPPYTQTPPISDSHHFIPSSRDAADYLRDHYGHGHARHSLRRETDPNSPWSSFGSSRDNMMTRDRFGTPSPPLQSPPFSPTSGRQTPIRFYRHGSYHDGFEI